MRERWGCRARPRRCWSCPDPSARRPCASTWPGGGPAPRYPERMVPTDPASATPASAPHHWALTFSCAERPGIVHAVSGAIVAARGNITESQQFASSDTGRFFMRLQVESEADRGEFERALAPVVDRFGMEHRVDTVGRPLRTLVLVSTAAHCLNDLLF